MPGSTLQTLSTALGMALALLLPSCAGKNAKPSKSDVSVLETEPTWTTQLPYPFAPEGVKLAGHPEAILVDGLTAEDETRRILVAIDPSAGRLLWERELGQLDTYEVRPSQTVFYMRPESRATLFDPPGPSSLTRAAIETAAGTELQSKVFPFPHKSWWQFEDFGEISGWYRFDGPTQLYYDFVKSTESGDEPRFTLNLNEAFGLRRVTWSELAMIGRRYRPGIGHLFYLSLKMKEDQDRLAKKILLVAVDEAAGEVRFHREVEIPLDAAWTLWEVGEALLAFAWRVEVTPEGPTTAGIYLHQVHPESRPLWSKQGIKSMGVSGGIVHDDANIYYTDDGLFEAVDLWTGEARWKAKVPLKGSESRIPSFVLLTPDHIIGSLDKVVSAYRLGDGEFLWAQTYPNIVSGLAQTEGYPGKYRYSPIHVRAGPEHYFASAATGKPFARVRLGDASHHYTTLPDGRTFVLDAAVDGSLSLVAYRPPAPGTPPPEKE